MSNDPIRPMQPQSYAPAHAASVQIEQQRAIAEAQAAVMLARAAPRDPVRALDRILNACARPGLAEAALYSYVRGGTEVSGPSIRLAEAIACQWGNITYGFRELERRADMSVVQAYAWDIEANVRREVTFNVRLERRAKGANYRLEDPRDIHEMVASQAARRLRACILAIIPGDIVEAAVAQCEETLRAKADTSQSAISKMLEAFAQLGVTRDMIEHRIQRRIESIQPAQMVSLKKIYASLRDGMSTIDDWFHRSDDQRGAPRSAADLLKEQLKEQLKTRRASPAQPAEDNTEE